MTPRADVEAFLALKTLALAGASRGGRKFGNTILKSLRTRGYEVLPIHPKAAELEGLTAYPSLADLPRPAEGLVVVVPPAHAEQLAREALAAGIRRLWFQQGASSPEALSFCEAHGMTAVHGECILMFAEPTRGIHRFHRWLRNRFGKSG
jgi:uncharacterized protein